MKCSAAILLGMSPSRREPAAKPTTPKMVAAEYGAMLKATADGADIGWEQLARDAGISTVSAWRLTKGSGSMKSALAMRAALEKRGVHVAPPAAGAALASEDMAAWIAMGQWLYDNDRSAFDQATSEIRKLIDAHSLVESGIRLISHPLPDSST